jgi:2-polyprenyl-6-methoxyphenol hydroxylase-like FAD-dependent oxidoreductase
VIERRSTRQIRSDGTFLTLAPNGVNALKSLGLADAVVAAGIVTTGLAIHNEHGRRLALVDYGAHGEVFGAPSVTIRRGALSAILLHAAEAAGVELRLEQELTGVAENESAIVIDAGGSEASFDALIACDGLRSTVRRLAFPDLPLPRYSGLIGTGGFAAAPRVAPTGGVMNMTFGRRAFFGYIQAPGQPVYWFNTYPAPQSEGGPIDDPVAYVAKIAAMHRDDPLDNATIMAAVPAIDRHYPIYDMPTLARWSSPRIVLMADAAHAVAPHSGQGASMAVEDALVLAACLARESTLVAAFRRFEGLRRRRTQAAIDLGRMSGSQKHAQTWLALRLRDLILPLVMPFGVKAQASLYRYRADLAPLAVPSR